MTEIIKIKGDWEEVVDDCRSTAGRPALGREPSAEFKRRILIAEHSPIRDLIIKWKWPGIKTWVATHWVRHRWEKFVSSQRDDRTGVPRDKLPQDAAVDFTGEANAQHLIDTMRKRLCYTAHPETRAYAEDLKITLRDVQPELSGVLVPSCVYRCGCPEMKPCKQGVWGNFRSFCFEHYDCFPGSMTIPQRYEAYNLFFLTNSGRSFDLCIFRNIRLWRPEHRTVN